MKIKLSTSSLQTLRFLDILKFCLVFGLLLFAFQSSALAIADWEWSKDKGWSQSSGRALPTPDEQLKYAYKLEKEGRYLNASKQYFLLLKAFPDSDESGVGLQRLANCLFMMENYYDAYKALEQVIKSYPFSAKKSDLIKIEFLIGRKFQAGAKVNLLDDNENPVIGKRAAIEIFESVVDNDPVGPYAGASLLAIASCYKDLQEPARGIVYADRVLSEFSMSSDLVAKARIIKKTMEVMQGDADINSVRTAISEAKKAASTDEHQGADDFQAVDDYDSEIRDLEEMQAKKLWDSADFYKKRGTRDSKVAYKFSLEQIIVRFPNTSYASKARRVIGDVKIPPKKNSYGKFNIPFISKKPPTFVAAPNSPDYVHSDNVPVPGLDGDAPQEDNAAAVALPSGSPEVPLGQDYAAPSDSQVQSVAPSTNDQEGGFDETENISTAASAPQTSSAPEAPPIPGNNNVVSTSTKVDNISVESPVAAAPVKSVARNSPIAPVGAGASAVPLGVTSNTPSRYNSTSIPRTSTVNPFDSAPESVKTKTSASAIPATIRQDSTIMEEAASKARVKANESAADSNSWSFSEDF